MSFICQTKMINTVKRALLEGKKYCKQAKPIGCTIDEFMM